MKLPKSLMIVGCAVLFASLFSGCGKQLSEEELLNNYNCYAHINLITEEYPDFTKKCEEKKLGKYSDLYREYAKASEWTISLDDGPSRLAKKKELKAKMDEWAKEPNKLPKEQYDKLREEHPFASTRDML